MKQRFATVASATAMLVVAGCSDNIVSGPQVEDDFEKYVAIGTSVSMGWQKEGVNFTLQEQAWTKQLATAAGATFRQPLIAAPGCKPPLAEPLGSFKRVDGLSVTAPATCSELLPGVTLPTNDLAVENATAVEALNATPETATQGRGPVTSRVLPLGKTQVTAMRASSPTFVSVEFGGNEVLPAQVGLLAPNVTYTPFATFQAAYAQIIDSVKATGAKAVLVGLPLDIRQFPTIRTGAEIAAQRTQFSAFNVTVHSDCDASLNLVFVRGKVLTAIATGAARAAAGAGPYTLSCADAPGTADFLLSPADVTFINALIAQMNGEIIAKASAYGYAYFSLESLYGTAKTGVVFDLQSFLTSNTPYGPKISLDGVHPSAEGHRILANAAISAINSKYGYNISPIGGAATR